MSDCQAHAIMTIIHVGLVQCGVHSVDTTYWTFPSAMYLFNAGVVSLTYSQLSLPWTPLQRSHLFSVTVYPVIPRCCSHTHKWLITPPVPSALFFFLQLLSFTYLENLCSVSALVCTSLLYLSDWDIFFYLIFQPTCFLSFQICWSVLFQFSSPNSDLFTLLSVYAYFST